MTPECGRRSQKRRVQTGSNQSNRLKGLGIVFSCRRPTAGVTVLVGSLEVTCRGSNSVQRISGYSPSFDGLYDAAGLYTLGTESVPVYQPATFQWPIRFISPSPDHRGCPTLLPFGSGSLGEVGSTVAGRWCRPCAFKDERALYCIQVRMFRGTPR